MTNGKNEIRDFDDLDAWKVAHSLVLDIYIETKGFPREEMFSLISQLRRAVVSITSNIAEGFSRYHFKDKIRFYYHSRGSVSEVKNQIIIARDLEYLNEEQVIIIINKCNQVKKLINGLIRSIEKQS